MQSKLIVFGTKGGPRIVKDGSLPTSAMLDFDGEVCIIDCGIGVTKQIIQSGYSLNQINKIIITHYHSDHTLEFGGLLHTAWCDGLNHPIDIYAPPGLIAMFNGFLQFQNIDIDIRMKDEGLKPFTDFFRLHEFSFDEEEVGFVFQDTNLTLKAMKNLHPPFTESYALRFEMEKQETKKILVISGDTAYYEPMIDFSADADLLLHEVMIEKGIDQICERYQKTKPWLRSHLIAAHTFAKDVGEIAQRAKVKHLAFYHYVPADLDGIRGIDPEYLTNEVRKTWPGKMTIMHDGSEIIF